MTSPHDSSAALAAEHATLQASASSTIFESSSRSSVYLSTLSSGLVATGLAAQAHGLLPVFSFAVLPTIFALGWFTVVRLVDTSVESAAAQVRIERIRSYYRSLDPDVASLFADEGGRTLGIAYTRWSTLSTSATMIGFVNAVVGGAAVALLLSSILAGVVAAVVCVSIVLVYVRWRIARVAGGAIVSSARGTLR